MTAATRDGIQRRRRLVMERLARREVLAAMVFDFSVDDGGFTTRGQFGGPAWEYTGSQWQSRANLTNSNWLTSPAFTAEATSIGFSMDHEYEFLREADTLWLNGGELEVSINGGQFAPIEIDGGYPVEAEPAGRGIFALRDRAGWGDTSNGVVTDTASVEVSEGDTVAFRLHSAWWEPALANPQWQVQSITINTGGAAGTAASVIDRNLFYDGAFFDADDAPGAGAVNADDNAIAADKTALLPGETATFTNYSSFSGGINGVMVDIADLATEPNLAEIGNYFEFATGNDDTPDDWSEASAPSEVNVRAGEGTDGSDRVTFIWDDGAVSNAWLQVTVLANESTGLEAPDVFYFGNAIGDSGNSASDAQVNAQDIGGPRDNPHNFLNRALIDDAFDYNRDSLVNAQDIGLARDNPSNFLNAVNLITVPAAAPAAAGVAGTTAVPVSDLGNAPGIADSKSTVIVALEGPPSEAPFGVADETADDPVTDAALDDLDQLDWSAELLMDVLSDSLR